MTLAINRIGIRTFIGLYIQNNNGDSMRSNWKNMHTWLKFHSISFHLWHHQVLIRKPFNYSQLALLIDYCSCDKILCKINEIVCTFVGRPALSLSRSVFIGISPSHFIFIPFSLAALCIWSPIKHRCHCTFPLFMYIYRLLRSFERSLVTPVNSKFIACTCCFSMECTE